MKKSRQKFFGLKVDDSEDQRINSLLKEARITLVEHHLLQACISSSKDMHASRDKVNLQVRGFDIADIKYSDLHSGLWHCASQVVAGKALE